MDKACGDAIAEMMLLCGCVRPGVGMENDFALLWLRCLDKYI